MQKFSSPSGGDQFISKAVVELTELGISRFSSPSGGDQFISTRKRKEF